MILEKLVIPIGFDMGLLLEGVNAIQGLITGAIERTQQWAEDMDRLGDVTGMETDKLASWNFVVKKAGVDADTFSNSVVIMAKGLLDSSGELSTTGKALQDFGVDVLDTGGKVRDQSDLMDDIAKKYAEFGTQTERVDFLTNVFGKSGTKLIDVFDTLAKEGGIDQVRKKVEDLGLVLDPNQYEEFQRNLNEVDLTFTGLANAFTGPLLPGAEAILQTFTTWLQSPWVADGIRQIGEALGTLITDISNGDWQKLWADIAPVLDPVALTQAFQDWIASVDWGGLSTTFATWISNVDWAGGTKAAIDSAVNIEEALIDLVGRTNWGALGQALKAALTGVFRDGIGKALWEAWEPAIKQFWIWVDNTLAQVEVAFSTVLTGNGVGSPYSSQSSGYVPGRAAGGMAGGLTWVGEKGPELVNLPGNSYVNNAQSSANMGIDYYKFATILAVEIAKLVD